jgi:hypothetical protein
MKHHIEWSRLTAQGTRYETDCDESTYDPDAVTYFWERVTCGACLAEATAQDSRQASAELRAEIAVAERPDRLTGGRP